MTAPIAVVGEEHRAEHRLLGLEVLRRHAAVAGVRGSCSRRRHQSRAADGTRPGKRVDRERRGVARAGTTEHMFSFYPQTRRTVLHRRAGRCPDGRCRSRARSSCARPQPAGRVWTSVEGSVGVGGPRRAGAVSSLGRGLGGSARGSSLGDGLGVVVGWPCDVVRRSELAPRRVPPRRAPPRSPAPPPRGRARQPPPRPAPQPRGPQAPPPAAGRRPRARRASSPRR